MNPLLTIAMLVAMTQVSATQPKQPADPPYIGQFPAVDRVMEDMKVENPIQASARQATRRR